MRKPGSIVLLCLLLFNWVGYQFYISLMERLADEKLINNIDNNNYSEGDLLSIKVPAPYLYYYAEPGNFERVNGKIDIDGVQYNYVKRRFLNDSLELLCIPNVAATRLRTAREAFFQLVNDLQHPGQPRKSAHEDAAFKMLLAKFHPQPAQFVLPHLLAAPPEWVRHYTTYNSCKFACLPGQPPDLT